MRFARGFGMKTIPRGLVPLLILAAAGSLSGCDRPGSVHAGPVQDAYAVPEDAAISASVKAALVAEPALKALQVAVDTKNGVVTLTGAVQDPEAVKRAAEAAGKVRGVKAVDNRLVVNSTGRG